MKKKEWIPYGIAMIACFIGAMYDYPITDIFYQPQSLIAIIFERFLMIPIQYIVIFTMIMQYHLTKRLFYFLFAILASVYMCYDFLQYWYEMNQLMIVFSIACSLLIVLFTLLIMRRVPMYTLKKRQSFLIFYTCVLLTSMVLTFFLKTLWGRVRYRDLRDLSDFCVWYRPCLMYGNHSFPSGHTTAFTAIICFLQWKQHPDKHISYLRYIIITVLIIGMPITRMMRGAHFLSDTAAGFMITYSCYLLYRNHFKRGGRL